MTSISTPSLFTVYYMNQQKVFETRMLLDNQIMTSGSSERQRSSSVSVQLSAETEFEPPFLTKLKAKLSGGVSHDRQQRVIDTLEYVNTKSRMLSDVMHCCKVPSDKKLLTEGDLVYLKDVSLNLINEDEVRSIMAIMSGTFDGLTVPDAGNLDIGHMMQAFVRNGAAFKMRGISEKIDKPLYVKIPLDGDGMFESKYTIDDLLIGKVGLVGICKGTLSPKDLKSPIDFFQKSCATPVSSEHDIVECEEAPNDRRESGGTISEPAGLYIDVLAVIQGISFKEE